MKLKWWAAFLTGKTLAVTEKAIPLGNVERLGLRRLSIKCCGKVHEIEMLYDNRGYRQWRRVNDFICTNCNRRGYID